MLPDSFYEELNELKISRTDRVLIALSGGLDSVVLAHLFAGFSAPDALGIAHMNFNLRGASSDADESFARELARKFHSQFHSKSVNTRNYATVKGLSIQMAARELRYSWFRELEGMFEYSCIATAHHLNDSLETVLLNLVRGTGPAGLRGIPRETHRIIRPLIRTSRDEIQEYARENQLEWREDLSNTDDTYRRNYLRLHIIPGLRELNPSLEATFKNTQRRLSDAYRMIRDEAERRKAKYLRQENDSTRIQLEAFEDHNIAVSEEILHEYGCNFRQVADMLGGLNQGGTQKFVTATHTLVSDRNELVITRNQPDIEPIIIATEGGNWEHALGSVHAYTTAPEEDILAGDMQATFDFHMVKSPLVLRKWKEGDWIRPLGMTGKKKVSDLMIDAKIPLNLKDRVCVLESAGELIWVIGLRISDKFKVTTNTSKYLNIVIENDQSV